MQTRRPLAILALSIGVSALLSACSQATRHRVLAFFFDGVPRPGERAPIGYAGKAGDPAPTEPDTAQKKARKAGKQYAHPPYRDNDCGGCHNMYDGGLFGESGGGLCAKCHTDPPGEARFLHGPVAVNACRFCHHHHSSPYPKMLHDKVPSLCFRCHRRIDLTEGPHHETTDRQICTDCHNPHGGSDRFFLEQDDR